MIYPPESVKIDAPDRGGLYVLLLQLYSSRKISIGRLGVKEFAPGIYVYVGSALGPGGLSARLARHMRPASERRAHWHIDHLLNNATVRAAAWSTEAGQSECDWAGSIKRRGRLHPKRFGASDCGCPGHLIEFKHEITISELANWIPADLQGQTLSHRQKGSKK